MGSGSGDGEPPSGGERTIGAGGVSSVAKGFGGSSSLGDGVSLGDRNADILGLDIVATSTDTNLGCSMSSASAEPLEEAGTTAGPPTAFMATDGVAKVGGEERAFAQ